MQQLPHRDAQDRAVDGGQALQRPPLQVRGDQVVDVRRVLGDAVGDGHGVRVQHRDLGVAVGDGVAQLRALGRGDAAGLGLEQQVDGALARLVPALVGTTVRH